MSAFDFSDSPSRGIPLGSPTLGVATAAGIVFALLSGAVYFAYAGEFALPVGRVVGEALAGIVE